MARKLKHTFVVFFPFLLLFSFSMFWADLGIINGNTKGNETDILNSY